MNYYHIRVYTPFCGEEADVYIAAETEKEYHSKANNAADENGMEWYDHDDWMERHHDDEEAEDEYYAQCGWRLMCMITEDEYNHHKQEGEWCI